MLYWYHILDVLCKVPLELLGDWTAAAGQARSVVLSARFLLILSAVLITENQKKMPGT